MEEVKSRRHTMTDEEVEDRIAELKADPDVRLAWKEKTVKYKRRRYLGALQSENNELRRAASQDRQSAFLTTAMNAQTNQIIGTLQQKAPVPAYQVPNPNAIYYGCGTGCGSCA